MDPRVKMTPEVLQIFTLTTQMEDAARNAQAAYHAARDLAESLKNSPASPAREALMKEVETIAPVEVESAGGGRGGRGGRGGGGGFGAPEEPAAPANLSNIGAELVASVQPMQASEMPPTAMQLEACHKASANYTAVMAKWAALRAKAGGPSSSGK